MASNNADDPWDWDVDRVVQELCTHNRSWSPEAGLISPDPALLEKSLRENDINGVMAVQYVNKQSLKDDLGINNLNQRSFVWCAIKQFQQSSPKWQVANPPQQVPQSIQRSELSRSLEGFLKHYPQHSSAPTIAPSAQQLLLPTLAAVASLGAQLNGSTSILQNGHDVNDEPESKRRKLDIADPAAELPPQFEDGFPKQGGHSPVQNGSNIFREEDDTSVPLPEPIIDDLGAHLSGEPSNSQNEASNQIPASELEAVPAQEVQKKPKKIAPTWVCAIDPNRDREILTAADDLNFDRGLEPESEEESVTEDEDIPEGAEDDRKRVPLSLISSDVNGYTLQELSANCDHLLGLVTQDGQSTDNDTPVFEADAVTAEQLHHESSGQAPFTASQVADTVIETAKPRRSRRARRHLAAYLGKDKLPVDDLFYKGIGFGQDLNIDTLNQDDLEFSSQTFKSKAPPGQSRYVSKMMRNFMLSKQDVAREDGPTIEVNRMMQRTGLIKQSLTRTSKHPRPRSRFATNLLVADIEKDGNVFTAVRTYPEGDGKSGLMSFFQTPSFTLYYLSSEGETRARREKVVDWPQLLDGKDRDGFKALSPLEAVGMRVDVDPDYLLAKYGHQVRLLPAYGDSGSEDDEKDPRYWREIEKELGEQIRSRPKNKPSKITSQEIDSAIDEAIAKLVQKWQEHKLPKLQKTAWSIWKKSRHFEQEDIEAARQSIHNLDLRIETQRKEFHTISWSNYGQAVKQGRIMEQTIFDRELLLWKISVIEQETSPEKPPKVSSLRSAGQNATVLTDDCEDSEALDEDDSDDGMGDFVIPDEEEGVEVQTTEDGPEDPASAEGSVSTPIGESDRSEQAHLSLDELVLDSDEILTPVAGNLGTLPQKTATKSRPPTYSQVIDLTMDSDSPPHAKASTKDSSAKVIDLCTPEKPQINFSSISKGSTPKIRLSVNQSSSPYELSSSPDPKKLPSYDDPIAIARYSYHAWSDLKDRDRLLIRVFYKLTEEGRNRLLEPFELFEEEELWSSMKAVMLELSRSESSVKDDPNTFDTLSELVQLYLMFIHCKFVEWGVDIPHFSLKIGLDKHAEWFPLFYKLCSRMRGYLEKPRSVEPALLSLKVRGGNLGMENSLDSDDDDEGPTLHRRARDITELTSTEDDIPEEESPHLKRKRPVVEDVSARDLRERNRLRLAEQEERRTILKAKLAKHGRALDKGKAKYIINDAAALDQGHIYIYKEIADHIKKHQIEGVRFMWNQIVTGDEESMQGCLLAHTMGLGKTMQTITLLVAIAEAASSSKHSISSQIPDVLKVSKTLVLCPPTLIDNWVDELLMWAPRNLLGSFWKLTSGLTMTERLETIREWCEVGGVLVIGYEMFRNLMNNSKARLTNEQHDRVVDELLNGPNIVVADEAHKMKNAKSKVTQAASQFRTKARIALTGSPLANNVEEYHAMISFTSPNYLGSLVEFKAKYKDPIEAGLYSDSTAHERRKCLKMLGLLNSELELKVHRAGMLVLRDDLPPKKEFVLSLPLTDIQRQVYSSYVKSLSAGKDQLTKDGEVNQTTLWSWLATLSLLCNHPYCFDSKIREEKEETTTVAVSSRVSTDQEASADNAIVETVNVPLSKTGLSKAFIEEVTALFKTQDLLSIGLSYKVTVLCQILDAAKAAGDKTLVFSSSIPTLDFLEALFKRHGRSYKRLDGSTAMTKRQGHIKAFNKGDDDIYLISTTAGGLGLNLQSANRVVVFDFKFNPTQEEQAVGRAYRIGQLKPTFVYRFVCGETFESNIHNKTVFKSQLASRVVDKKSVLAYATKKIGDFLYEPKEIPQQDLSGFRGMDPLVLDKILSSQTAGIIRSIIQTDTFEMDDEDKLTPEEQKELDQMIANQKLKRNGPREPQTNYQAHVQPVSRSGPPSAPSMQSNGIGSARTSHNPHENAIGSGFTSSNAFSTQTGSPSTSGLKVSQAAGKYTPMFNPDPPVARAYAAFPRDSTSNVNPSYHYSFSDKNPPILGANTRAVANSPSPDRTISGPLSTNKLMSAREPRVQGTPRVPSRVNSMASSPSQNNRPVSSASNYDSSSSTSDQSITKHSSAAQENSGTASSKKPIRNLVPILVAGYKPNISEIGSTESRLPDKVFLRAKQVSDEIRSAIANRFPSGQVRQTHLDSAFSTLGSNRTKCQELIDSKLSVDAFLRSLPEPVVAGSGFDMTKSAMYKAMNGRPPVQSLKTPVVKAPKPPNPNARDDRYEMERINQHRRASRKAKLLSPSKSTRQAKVASVNAHHSRGFSGASTPLSEENQAR